MIDFSWLTSIAAWSRTYCGAICAFLVPANVLGTLATLTVVGLQRPQPLAQSVASFGLGWAGLMVLHVATWWMVGVIMPPTFILLGLGALCGGINLWAIARPVSLQQFLQALWQWVSQRYQRYSGGNPV